jgi:hypothetical protein
MPFPEGVLSAILLERESLLVFRDIVSSDSPDAPAEDRLAPIQPSADEADAPSRGHSVVSCRNTPRATFAIKILFRYIKIV